MGLHPAGRRQAALPRRQRRRVRAGHLQGHPADDGQPARADRGRRSSPRTRSAPTTRSSTCAARSCTWSAGLQDAVARGVRRPATSARTSSAPASTSTSSCTPAPAPTSAARRRRCSTRSRAGAASRGCARRSPPSPGCTRRPTVDQQRRVDRIVPSIVAQRRRLVRVDGHREVAGLRAVLAVRPRHQARPVRGPARHHAARAARHGRRHPRGPRAEVLDPGRLVDADAHRRAPRRAAGLRGRGRGRLDARHPGAADLRRDHLAWCAPSLRWTEFYAHESCGKCTPCREGTLLAGADPRAARGGKGTEADLDKLLDICDNILGRSFCALGDGAASPITSSHQVLPRRVRRRTSSTAAARSTRRQSTLFARRRRRAPDDRHDQRPRPTSACEPHAEPRHRSPSTASRSACPRARWSSAPPSCSASRSRGSATTRCSTRSAPAASAWSRSPTPATAAAAQAAGVLHDRRSPPAWSSRPSSPRRSPTRPSRGSWSSC